MSFSTRARRSSITSLTLLTLVGPVACAGGDSTRDGGAVGGTVVVGLAGALAPTLPPLVQDELSRIVADLVYERLADIGPEVNTLGDQGYTPRLARRWMWAPDSLSIAFELDPRARWHDGRPVRASDVRFTFDLVRDPLTASPVAPLLANVDSVTVRDSLTVVAWFHRRSPEQFHDFVYQLDIVPEHILGGIPRNQLRAVDVNAVFVGSGRFRLQRFEPGVRLEMVADTAHYLGRPRLDRVVWAASSDAGAGITQFMAGQSDVWPVLPADVIPQVDSSATHRAVSVPHMAYAYMVMNLRRGATAPHPLFSDARVRRALSMAVDREAMARNVFGEYADVATGPYPGAFADSTIVPPPFDRAAAAALLDSAGWRMGPDSVRRNGARRLEFGILVPTSSSPRMRYAVLMQEQLRAVGVRARIDAVDIRAFIDRGNSRDFDALMQLWAPDPGLSGIQQSWTTIGITNGNNAGRYSSPRVDALVDSALMAARTDVARAYMRRAQAQIVADAPAIWLYDFRPVMGLHARIETTAFHPLGWWRRLHEWWIPEDRRIDRDRIGLRPGGTAAQPDQP